MWYLKSSSMYIVSNVNPLSLNVIKYFLNISHYQFTTVSRGLKLFHVSSPLVTTWCLMVYLSEYVFFYFFILRPLLKVLVLIECWLCDLSGKYLLYVPIYKDTTISISNLLASVERCFVSRMRDFFLEKCFYPWN